MLETAQLSMKVGSKGVPVISEKLQTVKKPPNDYGYLWVLWAT